MAWSGPIDYSGGQSLHHYRGWNPIDHEWHRRHGRSVAFGNRVELGWRGRERRGISTLYPIPSWQAPVSMATNGGSTTFRNVPDVALTAINVYERVDGEDIDDQGGTSCATPLWGGFMALVNQEGQERGEAGLGFINPAIYAIGLGSGYASDLHDITTGNNTSPTSPDEFDAVAGYDLCTGWGTPAGQPLINALTGAGRCAAGILVHLCVRRPDRRPIQSEFQRLCVERYGFQRADMDGEQDAELAVAFEHDRDARGKRVGYRHGFDQCERERIGGGGS